MRVRDDDRTLQLLMNNKSHAAAPVPLRSRGRYKENSYSISAPAVLFRGAELHGYDGFNQNRLSSAGFFQQPPNATSTMNTISINRATTRKEAA